MTTNLSPVEMKKQEVMQTMVRDMEQMIDYYKNKIKKYEEEIARFEIQKNVMLELANR